MKRPFPNVFAGLDSKTKSSVTRCYNALSHKSQALVETLQAPKKAKKRKAPPKSIAMMNEVSLGWAESGWVGLGWVGLGWMVVRLGWIRV